MQHKSHTGLMNKTAVHQQRFPNMSNKNMSNKYAFFFVCFFLSVFSRTSSYFQHSDSRDGLSALVNCSRPLTIETKQVTVSFVLVSDRFFVMGSWQGRTRLEAVEDETKTQNSSWAILFFWSCPVKSQSGISTRCSENLSGKLSVLFTSVFIFSLEECTQIWLHSLFHQQPGDYCSVSPSSGLT